MPDDRVRCVFVGAVIGEEAVLLMDRLTELGALLRYDGTTEAVRERFRGDVQVHRRTLAKLVPEAVRCGLEASRGVVPAWDNLDARMRTVIDRPSDGAVYAAELAARDLVQTVRVSANAAGVDPPLLRNLRRINASVPRPETKG